MEYTYFKLITNEGFCKELGNDNLFNVVRQDYLSLNLNSKDEDFLNIIKSVALGLNIKTKEDSDYDNHNKLEEAYPLISNLNWGYNNEELINYIKGLDLLKKNQAEEAANETSKNNKKEEA